MAYKEGRWGRLALGGTFKGGAALPEMGRQKIQIDSERLKKGHQEFCERRKEKGVAHIERGSGKVKIVGK